MSEIGVNSSGFFDKDLTLGKEVGKFNTEIEAKKAAGTNSGSELVYKSKYDGKWHVDELKQDGKADISKEDKSDISFSKSKMEILGVEKCSVSFVEENSFQVEAADPNTPKKRLAELAFTGDRDTKLAVAGNPSAPPEAFRGVSPKEPSPPPETYPASTTPAFKIEFKPTFVGLKDIRDIEIGMALAKNPAVPNDVLIELATRPAGFYSEEIDSPLDVAVALLKGAVNTIIDNTYPHRETIAGNPKTPAAVLDSLVKNDHKYSFTDDVKLLVAGNKSTGPQTLEYLAANGDRDIKVTVAGNQNTPFKTLQTLGMDDDMEVRMAVIRNPSTPKELQKAIVKYQPE